MTYQQLFLLLLSRFIVETTSLNDLVVDIKFISCPLVHGLFYAFLCDESKDKNSLGLSNTMGAILSLKISMRIPIGVETVKTLGNCERKQNSNLHDDSISSLQVQAKPTGPS